MLGMKYSAPYNTNGQHSKEITHKNFNKLVNITISRC